MPFMPFQILGIWLRGLVSIALLAVGVFLLRDWYVHRHVVVGINHGRSLEHDRGAGRGRSEEHRRREDRGRPQTTWHVGFNRPTAELIGGLVLVAWTFGGGWVGRTIVRRRGADEPNPSRDGAGHRLRRPDGSELQVESYGPPDGPPIVLTHGWGLDSTEWSYARRELADRYRLIVWDLPGLGQSTRPADNDWNLDKLAGDLDAVMALADAKPVTLSPLVWVMNWLSYLNGSAHRSTERSSFSGHETRGQLDFLTRFILWASPAVLARGMLAMFGYDATATQAIHGVSVSHVILVGYG